MCKCPACDCNLDRKKAWVKCPECGAVVHQKISKNGRVKKVVLHPSGYEIDNLNRAVKNTPIMESV